jgi:hypothetical protein
MFLAQSRSEINLAMDTVIKRDEPADESNDDGRRFFGSLSRRDMAR